MAKKVKLRKKAGRSRAFKTGKPGTPLQTPELERSRREHLLLDDLDKNPEKALKSKAHRETIKESDPWQKASSLADKHAPGKTCSRIAEIVCAFKIWRANTVPEVGKIFGASTVSSFFERDKKVFDRYSRKSKKMIIALRKYRDFLGQCENQSDGYKQCLDACNELISTIEKRTAERPSLHGTRLPKMRGERVRTTVIRLLADELKKSGIADEHAPRSIAPLLEMSFSNRKEEEVALDSIGRIVRRSRKRTARSK